MVENKWLTGVITLFVGVISLLGILGALIPLSHGFAAIPCLGEF